MVRPDEWGPSDGIQSPTPESIIKSYALAHVINRWIQQVWILNRCNDVREGARTVQKRDTIQGFPATSHVLIPCGSPPGQGDSTKRPVELRVIAAPGSFDRF